MHFCVCVRFPLVCGCAEQVESRLALSRSIAASHLLQGSHRLRIARAFCFRPNRFEAMGGGWAKTVVPMFQQSQVAAFFKFGDPPTNNMISFSFWLSHQRGWSPQQNRVARPMAPPSWCCGPQIPCCLGFGESFSRMFFVVPVWHPCPRRMLCVPTILDWGWIFRL